MAARPDERICLESRRHAVVLARPFAKAAALAAGGIALTLLGWPATVAAVVLVALATVTALRAVWRWERTRLVVTTRTLLVVHGTLRRRTASVGLGRVGAVGLEQTLAGRLLGYGTLVAGELEIAYVPEPRRVAGLVASLAQR